jgi:glycogen synthase
MKILIQHPHRAGEISGVLTSINELLPELRSRPELEVRVLSTKETPLREQLAAVSWADVVMLNSNCLAMAIAGRVLFRRTLLKLHYPQYQTVHWQFVPMSFGRRLATELRHLMGLGAGAKYFVQSVARLGLRTLVALIVHRVAACSGFCAKQSALPRDVRILKNPIRVPAGLPPRDVGLLDRPHRFVFIGRVTREKGWDTLVTSAALLAAEGREFLVDVAGDGDDLETMKQRAGAAGLATRFRFHGRLDPQAVQSLLEGAVAVVMPSRFQEPAGYIPLEAASRRVASIVSRVGGLAETAGPDCASFAAGDAEELAQYMTAFLDNPSLAVNAGYAAYLRAQQRFSPSLIADELLDILVARRGAQAARAAH